MRVHGRGLICTTNDRDGSLADLSAHNKLERSKMAFIGKSLRAIGNWQLRRRLGIQINLGSMKVTTFGETFTTSSLLSANLQHLFSMFLVIRHFMLLGFFGQRLSC
jgi:hypothetical protein